MNFYTIFKFFKFHLYIELWSELMAPLVNMIKNVCKKYALFILFIFHSKPFSEVLDHIMK